MKLQEMISVQNFLAQVHRCAGEVELHTAEGDVLNLKSALSQYLFAAISTNRELMQTAKVVCQNPADYAVLEMFAAKE